MTSPRAMRRNLPLAVVVGGGGGMGSACARRLSHCHEVIVADLDLARAQAVAEEIGNEGAMATAWQLDACDGASVDALAAELRTRGGVQAIAFPLGLSPSMADSRRIIEVNLVGAARFAEAVYPALGSGSAAVFVSSLAGHIGQLAPEVLALLDNPQDPDLFERLEAQLGAAIDPSLAYQLSKVGLMRMVRRLAARWGRKGARILSLSPGLIDTPMGRMEYVKNPQKNELVRRTPLGREGTLIEIADALEFLCSPRASFITGTDLLVDGGIAAELAFPAADEGGT